ncbi:MAG TPA: sialidase family protein [Pirellulaceae bacterium]|nr:sialidase family protein [Pirellulaceae bacterium]
MSTSVLSTTKIYDATGRPETEKIAYFTSLCVLGSGTLLSGFQLGRTKHGCESTIRVCRSLDGGASWAESPFRFETNWRGTPGSLAAGEMVEAEPGRVLLFTTWFDRSDPARPLFDPVTEGLLRSRQFVAESTDEGLTWSDWRELDMHGLTGCATTGPPLKWSDGTIAFAFESFKEYDDPRPAQHAAWLLVSRDGGRTFDRPWLVAQHPEHSLYYWDQRLCATDRPGEFFGLFWTHDRPAKRDRRVHQVVDSLDTPRDRRPTPDETEITGQIAAPLWLDDQRRLALVVDRDRPSTIKLWRSDDAGRTWPAELATTIYQHDERALLSQGLVEIDFAQYWEDMGKWSFGHPALRRLPDGRLLVAWYAGSPDRMSIHCATLP